MDTRLQSLDWSLLQTFLAVAEEGSLTAAAKRLGQSQPTLGRLVRTIEAELGAHLFQRHARGLSLTPLGAALLPRAQAMREAAESLLLTASGADQVRAGTVRVTASKVVSHYLLPSLIAKMRQSAPDIQIELVPSDTSENLLFREADIAIRMYRPTQLETVARKLGEIAIGAYAAQTYVARRGLPQDPDDLIHHDLVGYDRDERILQGFRKAGLPFSRSDFGTRCDDQIIHWELVRAGCGIGFSQVPVGAADPTVVRVLPDMPLPALPVWLTAHETLRHTPRVAWVWDQLAAGLASVVS